MSAEQVDTSSASAATKDTEQIDVVVGDAAVEEAAELNDESVEANSSATNDDAPSDADQAGAGAAANNAEVQPATAADLAALSTEELKKLTYESCEFAARQTSRQVPH